MNSIEQKFFRCRHCGNLAGMVHSSGAPMQCCGEIMQALTANTTDASAEKHVPVIVVDGNKVTVKVGSAAHPSLQEHYIEWIYLQTDCGGQRKSTVIGNDPQAVFMLAEGEKALAAFEYCNLHGLWKAVI